jgi:hypothetical protein
MAADGNLSVFVVRCFLLHRSPPCDGAGTSRPRSAGPGTTSVVNLDLGAVHGDLHEHPPGLRNGHQLTPRWVRASITMDPG